MGKLKRRRPKDAEVEYKVGYGKPPKQSQFKKGQSGNPKGRPKGARNFKSDLKATLQEPVRVTRQGRQRTITTQLAALLRLREKAIATDDARSLDRLLSLAQLYDDDGAIALLETSANDQKLIQLFSERIRSGAASGFGFDSAKQSRSVTRKR